MPWPWKKRQDAPAAQQTPQPESTPVDTPPAPAGPREPDAIYQGGKVVAQVADSEIDLDAKEIRFGEIFQSDLLVLPDECEFRDYRIMVQRIAFATKAEPVAMQKGRVLRGVIADILGYREQ